MAEVERFALYTYFVLYFKRINFTFKRCSPDFKILLIKNKVSLKRKDREFCRGNNDCSSIY